MGDETATFFEDLRRRGHEPLLEKAAGTIRFDLAHGGKLEHWLVTLDRGAVAVSRRRARAAVLRGELTFDGDPELLVRFQRLLPNKGDRR